MTPQEIRDEFCQIPFDFKPGKRFLYNNSGYHLLGMIIEQVSGIEYEQFVQQEIFDPLGMKRSFFMHNAAIIPRRANGYSRDEGGFKNADYLSMTQPYASGSLGSTVEDMVLWTKAVYENRLRHRSGCGHQPYLKMGLLNHMDLVGASEIIAAIHLYITAVV